MDILRSAATILAIAAAFLAVAYLFNIAADPLAERLARTGEGRLDQPVLLLMAAAKWLFAGLGIIWAAIGAMVFGGDTPGP